MAKGEDIELNNALDSHSDGQSVIAKDLCQ